MPWKAFKRDSEWCVFRIDGDGAAMGDSLGCHDTRREANAQIAALNINVEEQEDPMNDVMLASTVLEISGQQVTLAELAAAWMGEQVKKTVRGEKFPRADFLVVEDPEKPTTWHLQVKKNGTPDRRLMGAAWAALHGEFRGNKYEGPDKRGAIRRLRALYNAEDVDVPTAEMAVEEAHRHEWGGEGPDVAIMPDGSWSARSFADLEAARAAEQMAATVEQRTEEFKLLFNNIMRDSEIEDKRTALMALVDEFVNEIEAIEPTEEAAESENGLSELAETDSLSILEILPFEEQEQEEPQHTMVRVAVIEPGLGNARDRHYYGREMLERDANIFEGTKMYLTEHDDKDRSVRTEVSQIVKCPVGFSGTGAPLADVAIYDAAFAHNVRERNHHGTLSDLHCSILASGKVRKGVEMDGDKVNVVEAITEARAVDWVTRAGAGGRALSLVENDSEPEDTMTDEIVLDEGQSVEEEQEQETVEEQLHENDEQQDETPERMTVSEALIMLLESGLSPKQQTRLAARNYGTTGELEGAIAEMKEILAEAAPASSAVFGMGPRKSRQQEPEDAKSLEEQESELLRAHGIGWR